MKIENIIQLLDIPRFTQNQKGVRECSHLLSLKI